MVFSNGRGWKGKKGKNLLAPCLLCSGLCLHARPFQFSLSAHSSQLLECPFLLDLMRALSSASIASDWVVTGLLHPAVLTK